MSTTIITSSIDGLGIPRRLLEIVIFYILSLMLPTDKHSLTHAEKISGKSNSLFSNLLNNINVPQIALNRAAKRKLAKLMKSRSPLVAGAHWSIAILIDSTLHKRATRHTENSQKFNHGKGFILGHQWTNIALLIDGQLVPLPPIPFYTEAECKNRKIKFRSEHDKIIDFLRTMSFKDLFGEDRGDDIVVILDSGYDNNDIQNIIVKRGMSYVVAIKKSRNIFIEKSHIIGVDEYFKDGRRPSKTIELRVDGQKKRKQKYNVKQHVGNLKGMKRVVKIVCSKKSKRKMKFLSCSNPEIDAKIIIAIYQKRWNIELFHRSVKSYLGMEDGAFHSFDRLHAHVLWVYLSYLLLHELPCKSGTGIKKRQEMVANDVQKSSIKKILKKATQVNGVNHVKHHCLSVIKQLETGEG